MSARDWENNFEMNIIPEDWFLAAAVVPNLIFSLGYQVNYFPIYKGMKDSCDKKMGLASLAAIICCGASYMIVGELGYALYGGSDRFTANFLLSIRYDQAGPLLFYGMNLSFLISVLFSFPIMFFGARNNFIALMKLLMKR